MAFDAVIVILFSAFVTPHRSSACRQPGSAQAPERALARVLVQPRQVFLIFSPEYFPAPLLLSNLAF